MRSVADAAMNHKKIAGGVFVSPKALIEAVKFGFRLVVSTADVALLATGSKEKAREVRQNLDDSK